MKVIVLNCGSSSIKYQLFDMPSEKVLAKGLVEKIGLTGSGIKHKRQNGDEQIVERKINDHKEGISLVFELLTSSAAACLKSLDEVDAVGHRVVHGGEEFSGSVHITEEVIQALKDCIELAPLHNPPNLEGIFAIESLMPDVRQVGVFDTAFHQTMPSYSYLYGLPYEFYTDYKVRKYGFHGTSHKYVASEAAAMMKKDPGSLKLITCHLGNGSSITAVKNGQSVDTSMGMTPLEGLIMGTRSGDLDIGALLFMAKKMDLSIEETNNLVNKKCGLLGVSGVSSDMRDIEHAADNGNPRAQLALEMFAYRVRKYIGAYVAAMNGLDAIVFTGGIGENDQASREKILSELSWLGADLDVEKNRTVKGTKAFIHTSGSRVKIMVIPTNEELMIARDTFELVSQK